MLKIYDFSVEYVKNAKIIPVKDLRFGWKLESDHYDVLQRAYQIRIKEGEKIVADTQQVISTQLCDIKIPDLCLKSCTDYFIELHVWDNKGEEAEYIWQTATEILPEEWGSAKWIKPARYIAGWAPYLRTKFKTGTVKKAIMYASGLGVAEYYINGKRTDDFYMDPPISNYEKNVFYRRFDVTDMICEGGNAIAVLLGEGFYSQSIVWETEDTWGPDVHHGLVYGDVCVKMKLMLYLEDGSVQEIVTNTEDWKSKYSPITTNNIYAGETYDARLETPDFAEYESEEWGWEPVDEDETPKGVLTPCMMAPVKVIRELPAVAVQGSSGAADGSFIFDIGENIAGIAEYHLPRAPRGNVYVFRYAETLNAAGSLDHRSTGGYATQCVQQDIYICRGDEEGEVYRPRLNYHGFRYIEITGIHDVTDGYCTVPKLTTVKGIQLSTEMEKAGNFTTSYEPLDHLYKIMENTYRSNFHGVPEDCPAREKCGWLGDAQIVSNWGLLNYDSAAAYEKYLQDIRTTKEVYGTWLMIAPGKRGCGEATPLWGCAQIIIPYNLYKYCGDKDAVLKNADLMKAWIEHEEKRAEDYIISEGLGDWCPPVGHESPRRIPVTHSSTIEFYEICVLMAQMCEELGIGDKEHYLSLAAKIKESFNRHFYDIEKHTYGTWGADGAALAVGIYPEGEKEALLAALVEMIEKDDYEMPTGIYANKYLVPELTEAGYGDMALKFLFHEKHWSFKTMLDEGATTIWEGFGSHYVEPNRNIGCSSYDHPMHGGFLYYCNTHLAGIKPLKPGFEQFVFKPCFTSMIDQVKAHYDSVYGRIEAEIKKFESGYACILKVPAGSSALIDIDGQVFVNGKAYKKGTEIGSGSY